MKGFNPGAVIPKRNLKGVKPMRFNLVVKLHPEKEEPTFIVMPDSAKRHRDSTRGWFGTVMAVGDSIPKMKKLVGAIKPGVVCLFDESVSIDDPNRCFDWEDERFVMFDIETVMAIVKKRRGAGGAVANPFPIIEMLGDRILVRKAKKDDFKITKSKIWLPESELKQEVGGVVTAIGPGVYSHATGRYAAMDFKVGDFVLYSKYSGTDIKIEGNDYLVLRQDKVLAIVEGESERIQFA